MFCFVFFKQKTAYEMRISDWSSDVCSSDLFAGRLQYPACLAERLGQQVPVLVNGLALVWANDGFICAVGEGLEPSLVYITEFGKIGRASCRERVCQYV